MSISDWSSDVCSSDLTWLEREGTVLRAYVAGISARLFTQRATAILSADIFALPYPEDEDLDLSQNERIIAEDIIAHQRDFRPEERLVGKECVSTGRSRCAAEP